MLAESERAFRAASRCARRHRPMVRKSATSAASSRPASPPFAPAPRVTSTSSPRRSRARSSASLSSRSSSFGAGQGILGTVSSTAPFVGLLGTVARHHHRLRADGGHRLGGSRLRVVGHRRGARHHRHRPLGRHSGRVRVQLSAGLGRRARASTSRRPPTSCSTTSRGRCTAHDGIVAGAAAVPFQRGVEAQRGIEGSISELSHGIRR